MKGYVFYMKKSSKNKSSNNFPFANEIKESKYEFKKMIDEMPDEEFIDFILLFMDFVDRLNEFDDYEDYDEQDEYEELPF